MEHTRSYDSAEPLNPQQFQDIPQTPQQIKDATRARERSDAMHELGEQELEKDKIFDDPADPTEDMEIEEEDTLVDEQAA